MTKWITRGTMLLVLGYGLSMGVGCSCAPGGSAGGGASNQDVTLQSLLLNMTPELYGLGETEDQVDIKVWRTVNYGWRQVNDDFHRAMLLDRPSRMSYLPIP